MKILHYTDENPVICAENLPWRCVVPELETAARLISKFLQSRRGIEVGPYEFSLYPPQEYLRWISQSFANIEWLFEYAQALQSEYSRVHNKIEVLNDFKVAALCFQLAKKIDAPRWKSAPWSPPPTASTGFTVPTVSPMNYMQIFG